MNGEQIPVSVIVMTLNEERNIGTCLASLTRFDEVFVVDSGSTDRTCELAAEFGAHVVPFTWDGGYPKKKQWCLDNLPFSHSWVLYLDADEALYPALAEEIRALLERGPQHAGYFAGFDYVFLGKVLRHGARVRKLVLFDRARGRFVDYPDLDATNMWEVEGHYQPAIDGSITVLQNRILHADHDSLFHWFERHNRYSDWEAVVRANNAIVHGRESQPRTRFAFKKLFDRLAGKGIASFLYGYVLRLGFLDGRAGLQYALAKSFYYWQVGLKQRELRQKTATTSTGKSKAVQ
jgi:glycosyltransferase involved in cell wall biosynthesis